MAVGALPIFKLAILAVKQLSKPIANIIKERAKQSPFFRQYICMPPAQFIHQMEVRAKMWSMNLGKPHNIPKLNEAMAIDLGANFLGECVIYSIGSGLLVLEYIRSSNKEAAKEALIQQEKLDLVRSIQELALRIEQQDAELRHLTRTVVELDSRKWLPRLKILSKDDGGDDGHKSKSSDVNNNTSSGNVVGVDSKSVNAVNQIGNYNNSANASIIHRALHLIDNEIFYSEPAGDSKGHRIIEDALVYLKFTAYEQ